MSLKSRLRCPLVRFDLILVSIFKFTSQKIHLQCSANHFFVSNQIYIYFIINQFMLINRESDRQYKDDRAELPS